MSEDPLSDKISSVVLLDSMGTDLTVVNAARVSLAKVSDWDAVVAGDVTITDPAYTSAFQHLKPADAKLITYLATHAHWTPFAQVMFTLRIRMPLFVARQWFKHQVGFTRNEESRRYIDTLPEYYVPQEWRLRAENVKQGSSDEVHPESRVISTTVVDLNFLANQAYLNLLDLGVAPEQARMVLPQSMYTEFVETGSLAAYARLYGLRHEEHAQRETQLYAAAIANVIRPIVPVSWRELTRDRN